MKNLKKFAALLLAGAMALLMLTACGGGGGGFGKRDPDAEDKAFNRFTSTAQASGLKENDKSLQAVAEGHLKEDLNSSIEILGAKLPSGAFFVPVGRGGAPAPFCAVTKAAGKAKAAACLPKGSRLLFVCLVHRHRKPPEVSLPTVLCMMIGGSKNDRHIIAA